MGPAQGFGTSKAECRHHKFTVGISAWKRPHCAKTFLIDNLRVSATVRSLVQRSPTECVLVMECDEVEQKASVPKMSR